MQGAPAGGGEGELLGSAVPVVGRLDAVRPFETVRTAGAAGLGTDGAAEPAVRVEGRVLGVEAFQEAEPDRLLQVAGLRSGGMCLRGRLGGE
jgi:hypothetical protein